MNLSRMRLGAVGLALVATVAACGGSSTGGKANPGASSGASASSSGGTTTPTHLALDANGQPRLNGVTIAMGNAAGDATIGDTVAYLTSKVLQQWGAHTSFQLGNGNNTELAVVSGQLADTAGPLDTCIDAGLTLFGPNQVHVDYLLVSDKATTVQGLKGKTVALATAVSPDQNLLSIALQNAGLTRSAVHVFLSGANSASESALLKGAVDAAWVHADALLKLQKAGTFHVLTKATQTAPYLADSYMCAKPSWLTAHPAYAQAIDLAWIEAANVFNNNESQWVQAAQAYTKGAESASDNRAAYTAIKQADPWSLADQAHFDASDVAKNYNQAKSTGRIKAEGNRPQSQWLDLRDWQAAWQVYQSHTSTYGG